MSAPAGPSGPFHQLRTRTVTRLDAGGTYPRWVLLTALTGMFATTFPITVLTVAIPEMAADFGVGEATLAWVVTLPILLSAVALPVLGKLGDLYGHRRVFLVGFALATVTTALSATAWSAGSLIGWRTLTAVLGAATMPSSLALINTEYPPERRAKAMGWWAMIAAGAPVIGLAMGGPLIDAFGWRVLFLVQAAFMVVPVVASAVVLRETPRRQARFDIPGSIALASGVAAAMVALTVGAAQGFGQPIVLGCLFVAPLALAAFVRIERRATAPLLPLGFFAHRDFGASIVATFFTSASYMGGYFLATLMVVGLFDYTASAAVVPLMIRPLVFAAGSPLGGYIATRWGNRRTALVGTSVLAVSMATLATAALRESMAVAMVGFVLQGLAYGLLRPPVSTAMANSVDNADLGIAAASERMLGQVGTAFGITLLTVIYAGALDPDRFALAFGVGGLLAVFGVAAAANLRPAHAHATRQRVTEPAPAGDVVDVATEAVTG